MLDALGKEYLSQHVWQAYRRRMIEKSFRVYVAEALQIISENTSGMENRKYITVHWNDLINETPIPDDTRTPEEVVEYMKGKLAALSLE